MATVCLFGGRLRPYNVAYLCAHIVYLYTYTDQRTYRIELISKLQRSEGRWRSSRQAHTNSKFQQRGLLKINQSEETPTPDENGTEDHESQQALKPNEPGHLPQEALIHPSRSDDPPVNIDPALHAQDANQTAQQPDDNSHTGNMAPAPPEADPTMQNPTHFRTTFIK